MREITGKTRRLDAILRGGLNTQCRQTHQFANFTNRTPRRASHRSCQPRIMQLLYLFLKTRLVLSPILDMHRWKANWTTNKWIGKFYEQEFERTNCVRCDEPASVSPEWRSPWACRCGAERRSVRRTWWRYAGRVRRHTGDDCGRNCAIEYEATGSAFYCKTTRDNLVYCIRALLYYYYIILRFIAELGDVRSIAF